MFDAAITWAFSRLARRSLSEASPGARRFEIGNPAMAAHAEAVGRAFLEAYNAALTADPDAQRLDKVDARLRGFAYEGTSMALALRDLKLGGSRWAEFAMGAGNPHIYVCYVGAGWTMGIHRGSLEKLRAAGPDALLNPLLVDGYGFYCGYYFHERYLSGEAYPARLQGYDTRAFDQGLGRSLWFIFGADVARIQNAIARLNAARHADLWSGVGLACTYAGGVEESTVRTLARAATGFEAELAQGSAFAAEARLRGNIPAPSLEIACPILCGCAAEEAAAVARNTREGLRDHSSGSYEDWRGRIRHHFSSQRRAAGAGAT